VIERLRFSANQKGSNFLLKFSLGCNLSVIKATAGYLLLQAAQYTIQTTN